MSEEDRHRRQQGWRWDSKICRFQEVGNDADALTVGAALQKKKKFSFQDVKIPGAGVTAERRRFQGRERRRRR